MRLYNIYGRLVNYNVSQYLIDWDTKSASIIQATVKRFLKPYWKGCVCYEEFPCFGSLLRVDILNMTRKIAVEIQGKQHYNFNKHFHLNNPAQYLKSIKNDYKKAQWLEKNDIKLIEVMEEEISYLTKEFFEKKFDITL